MAKSDLYKYEALASTGSSFRLLSLHPGSFSDDILVSLHHADISNAQYEALSYAWGPKPDVDDSLPVAQSDGTQQFIKVRPSVIVALKYLRHPTAQRSLWVDVICIDQENTAERSQQVQKMGDIYQNATQVLVWLGPDDSHTTGALHWIKTLAQGINVTPNHRGFIDLPGTEAATIRNRPTETTMTASDWADLRAFITRPWFQRLWIRQEAKLATKVSVLCGYYNVVWDDLEKVALLLEQSDVSHIIEKSNTQFVRSIFPYVGSENLSYILHRSSLCGFSEPRDVVYANLSTSEAIKALQIEPDYDLPLVDVYRDLVLRYIRKFGHLDILRSCDLESLPQEWQSFVPDFSKAKSESRLCRGYSDAGSRHLPCAQDRDDRLELRGKAVATINYVSEFRKPPSTGSAHQEKVVALLQTCQRWEPDDLLTATYPTGGSLLDAFIMLLPRGVRQVDQPEFFLPTFSESKEAFMAVLWTGGDGKLTDYEKFWRYFNQVCADRRGEIFFRTAEGYIGTSSSAVEPGDIVVSLVGGMVPFILRPAKGVVPPAYRIVGPCWLHGIMNGEALLGPIPEPWCCILSAGDLRRYYYNKNDGTRTSIDPRLWTLPAPWEIHFCDTNDTATVCQGGCTDEYKQEGWAKPTFFNSNTHEVTKDDPRLDIPGMIRGGVALDTFLII